MGYQGNYPPSTPLTSSQIGTGAVTTDAIADGAVVPADLSTGAPYWNTSGNVGVGTTSPAKKLHVNGDIRLGDGGGTGAIFTDATNGLRFMLPAAGTSNTESMRLDSSGNLGIGTSSPSTYGKLAVSTPTAGYGFLSVNNSAGGGGGGQLSYYYGTAKVAYVDSAVSNGTPGSETASLAFATANSGTIAERMRIDSSGNVGIGTSSPAAKLEVVNSADAAIQVTSGNNVSRVILNNTGTGGRKWTFTAGNTAYSAGALYLEDLTAGATRLAVDSSGNLLVGTTTAVGKATIAGNLSVAGSDNAIIRSGGNSWLMVSSNLGYGSAGAHLKLDGGGGTWIFNNTTTTFYVASAGIYSTTTASAANMYVDSGNQLYRSTSSLKYKTDVKDATYGLAEVMQLRPVTYKGKNDGDKVFGGLIAEEVDAVGLTEFVQYAEDGSPDALAYGNMVSLLVKAIQQLKAELDALKGTK